MSTISTPDGPLPGTNGAPDAAAGVHDSDCGVPSRDVGGGTLVVGIVIVLLTFAFLVVLPVGAIMPLMIAAVFALLITAWLGRVTYSSRSFHLVRGGLPTSSARSGAGEAFHDGTQGGPVVARGLDASTECGAIPEQANAAHSGARKTHRHATSTQTGLAPKRRKP